VKNLKYTYYSFNKSKIENTDIQNMLFNGNYWLASRCVNTISNNAGFLVRRVYGDVTDALTLCYGVSYGFYVDAYSDVAVRPVVTLKSDIIDVNTNYSTEGEWKLK